MLAQGHVDSGMRIVELVTTEFGDEFRRLVRRHSRAFRIDMDELFQAAILRLLCQRQVDPQHDGLWGWLDRCVRYTALDHVRGRSRRPPTVEVGSFPDVADESSVEIATNRWSLERLLSSMLTEDQLKIALALADDVDLHVVADRHRLSYDNVRKIKSRALARLRSRIGLTGTETLAFVAWRRGCTVAEVAETAGIDQVDVEHAIRSAAAKVRRVTG